MASHQVLISGYKIPSIGLGTAGVSKKILNFNMIYTYKLSISCETNIRTRKKGKCIYWFMVRITNNRSHCTHLRRLLDCIVWNDLQGIYFLDFVEYLYECEHIK